MIVDEIGNSGQSILCEYLEYKARAYNQDRHREILEKHPCPKVLRD